MKAVLPRRKMLRRLNVGGSSNVQGRRNYYGHDPGQLEHWKIGARRSSERSMNSGAIDTMATYLTRSLRMGVTDQLEKPLLEWTVDRGHEVISTVAFFNGEGLLEPRRLI